MDVQARAPHTYRTRDNHICTADAVGGSLPCNDSAQVAYTRLPLSPGSIVRYQPFSAAGNKNRMSGIALPCRLQWSSYLFKGKTGEQAPSNQVRHFFPLPLQRG